MKKQIPFGLLLIAGLTLVGCAGTPIIVGPNETPAESPPGTAEPEPPVASSDLAGTVWTLVSFGPADAPAPPLSGTEISAEFTQGGINGSAGCNRYFGTATVSGDELSIGPLASTEMFCMDPDGAMDQELQFLAALGAAERFVIDGEQLRILHDGGTQVLVFSPKREAEADSSGSASGASDNPDAPASTINLAGTAWILQSSGAEGTEEPPLGATTLTLLFGTGDTLLGNAGCNNYQAPYEIVDSNTLKLGAIGVTKKLCPKEIMLQEQAFLEALSTISGMRMDDDGLHLTYGDGQGVLHFEIDENAV